MPTVKFEALSMRHVQADRKQTESSKKHPTPSPGSCVPKRTFVDHHNTHMATHLTPLTPK